MEVQLESLNGEQMDRNRIARKRIHREQAEVLSRFALEPQARIAQHDVEVRQTVVQEAELRLGEVQDQRIDLIVTDAIAGSAEYSQSSSTQTNDIEVHRAVAVDGANAHRHARMWAVIGGGRSPARRVEKLLAVIDGTVRQDSGS